ncbi:hypothetical protein E2C01_097786 [Portunus trituberculatus]|uniref:Uncharacterized protein n=1 Tax=Portunus trituberculatus TaxID=210409 RepID=A0A5B7KAZ2_PORTR|nr:hypothetical protein [Portunus trituberculatus]
MSSHSCQHPLINVHIMTLRLTMWRHPRENVRPLSLRRRDIGVWAATPHHATPRQPASREV